MEKPRWERVVRDLAVTLALILLAEVIVRVTGWDRLWVLLGVLGTGQILRVLLASRRTAVKEPDGSTAR